jgi:hypothetical protein
MQVLEGYFVEQDKFIPLIPSRIPMFKRAIITILDEPVPDKKKDEQLAAMDEFINANKASNEAVPEFTRVNFRREVDI